MKGNLNLLACHEHLDEALCVCTSNAEKSRRSNCTLQVQELVLVVGRVSRSFSRHCANVPGGDNVGRIEGEFELGRVRSEFD